MKQHPQLFGKTLFVDLMMSTLVVVTALLMASNAVKKQTKAEQEAGLRTEGQYAVVMTWPDDSQDDVDLYVRDPNGKVVYFAAREFGLMHLEHDDRGIASDTEDTGSGDVTVEHNEERVILRGTIPGEYVVNAHMFSKRDGGPTTVRIRLVRLKGEDSEIVGRERVLRSSGDEATAFRFTAHDDGSIGDINELPYTMTGTSQHANPFGPRGGF